MDKSNKLYYESNNYLQHFGVKGMKWGVRRYQKSNGNLTLRGRRLSKKYKNIHLNMVQS